MNNNEPNTSNEVNNPLNNVQPNPVTPTMENNPEETPTLPVAPEVEPNPVASVEPAPTVEGESPTVPVGPAIEASASPQEPIPSVEPPVPQVEPAPAPAPEPPAPPIEPPVAPVPAPEAPNAPAAPVPPVEPASSVTPTPETAPTPESPAPSPMVAQAPAAPEVPNPAPVQVTPAGPVPTPPQTPVNNDPTIGKIKKEKKSIVPVILIFVVIIGVCIALPYIYDFVSPYFEKKAPTPAPIEPLNPTPDNPTPEEPTVPVVSDPITIGADATLTYDKLNISNISLQEEDRNYYINYTITNNGTESYSNETLYVELYNADNTFLGRAKVPAITALMVGSNLNLRSEISDAVYSSASKVNVVTKTELDYPNVTLNETNTLVCRKGINTVTYTFVDNKLTTFKEVYDYTIAKTETEKYASDSLKYRNMLNSYINYGAITSFIENETETDSTFTATLTLTLSDTFTSEQKAALKQMNNSIFDKDTAPKVIKFEQEANAYICE